MQTLGTVSQLLEELSVVEVYLIIDPRLGFVVWGIEHFSGHMKVPIMNNAMVWSRGFQGVRFRGIFSQPYHSLTRSIG